MRSFKIDEISAVDRPAQRGARALIMKRDGGADDPVEKRVWLTDSVEGHAHLVDDQTYDGQFRDGGDTSWTNSEDADSGHTHPWVRNSDGSITVGQADGHDHAVLETKRAFTAEEREKLAEEGKAMSDGGFPIVTVADLKNAVKAFGRAKNKSAVARHIKRRAKALDATDLLPEEGSLADLLKTDQAGETANKEGDMPKSGKDKNTNDNTGEALEAATKRAEKAEADLVEAKARADMTDAQKAHFDGLDKALDDDKRKAFLAKSADERQAEVEESTKADSVVYTAKDGTVYRKSDDPRLANMAKDRDADREALDKSTKAVQEADLRKRAETDLKHMPGTVETRMAMLKAIASIEDDEEREAAEQALKAQNESMSKAFENAGVINRIDPLEGSPEAELDTLAKKYAADHKVHYATAYDAVLRTQEGGALYAKHTGDDKLAPSQIH
jgi:hypothetical protein